jgi:hypothetical protein
VTRAEAAVSVHVPTVANQAAPSFPTTGGFKTPLASHQVVGFLPYWDLGSSVSDYADLTTLVYWSVSPAADGSIVHGGDGWSGLKSNDLVAAVNEAHAVGDRVLLTVFSQNYSLIGSLTRHPTSAGRVMAEDVAVLLRKGDFDGVDIDLEGDSGTQRSGFVRLIASFSHTLRSIHNSWSIMLDTYASSASDPSGFFDVKALMAYVDDLFVMAYDMQDQEVASATAPLTNASLNDASTLAQYASVVPIRRIVLGIPLYGYDFVSSSRLDGAEAEGNPTAVTYAQIVAAGHKAMWDPVTETPYTVVHRNGKWHQTWFDDPLSIALKTALAAQFGCAGVGVWELGMSGGDASIYAALLAGKEPLKLTLASGDAVTHALTPQR